jgi:hypothetical protein
LEVVIQWASAEVSKEDWGQLLVVSEQSVSVLSGNLLLHQPGFGGISLQSRSTQYVSLHYMMPRVFFKSLESLSLSFSACSTV